MAPPPSPPANSANATIRRGGATTLSDIDTDVLQTHILTRLDGPALASTSCASAQLRRLSADDTLWSTICSSTWPSTAAPQIRRLISAFPGGPRKFFSQSFPLLLPNHKSKPTSPPPPELISAVDIHFKGNLLFTKVQETETISEWFMCSPFRIDLLDPKEAVPTAVRHPDGDAACAGFMEDVTLSWVLIDPTQGRAANMSTHKPVSVNQHWLTGEVELRFASIVAGKSAANLVECGIVVTCGGSEGGDMQVREVSLKMEDMEGKHLTGKDSLVILNRAMDGTRGNTNREEEGRRRYGDYLEMKRERIERKMRNEGTLDMLCVGFGIAIFASFWVYFLCR